MSHAIDMKHAQFAFLSKATEINCHSTLSVRRNMLKYYKSKERDNAVGLSPIKRKNMVPMW